VCTFLASTQLVFVSYNEEQVRPLLSLDDYKLDREYVLMLCFVEHACSSLSAVGSCFLGLHFGHVLVHRKVEPWLKVFEFK
jgi:hypothetical protein